MKKNKIIKITYLIFGLVSILSIFVFLIRPFSSENIYAHYDTTNEIIAKEYSSSIEQNIYISNDRTFKLLLLFGDEQSIDNWEVSLTDEKGNVLLSKTIKKYTASGIYFAFDLLEKGKNYTLKILDTDNDSIVLNSVKSDSKTYLVNDPDYSLQIATTYYKYNYFYLWYPLFLLSILYLIFPYVWGDRHEKK